MRYNSLLYTQDLSIIDDYALIIDSLSVVLTIFLCELIQLLFSFNRVPSFEGVVR